MDIMSVFQILHEGFKKCWSSQALRIGLCFKNTCSIHLWSSKERCFEATFKVVTKIFVEFFFFFFTLAIIRNTFNISGDYLLLIFSLSILLKVPSAIMALKARIIYLLRTFDSLSVFQNVFTHFIKHSGVHKIKRLNSTSLMWKYLEGQMWNTVFQIK